MVTGEKTQGLSWQQSLWHLGGLLDRSRTSSESWRQPTVFPIPSSSSELIRGTAFNKRLRTCSLEIGYLGAHSAT